MNHSAFVLGFAMALLAVMILLLIRLWTKDKLERWGYELTRETHSRLQQIELKMDSLLRAVDRLERTGNTLAKTVNELRPGAAEGKTAA